MSQQKYGTIVEDFDEKENNENTSLLNKNHEDPNTGFRGFFSFLKLSCFRRRDTSISEEEFGDDLFPAHLTQEKEEVIRQGIHTFSLLVVALVAIGVALIYLSFILVPLVLAWFFVYVFQPFINYMVGKKAIVPGTNCRVRLPRPVAVVICALAVLGILVLLGLAIYFSILEITKNSDVYIAHLNKLYNDIMTWAQNNGFGSELNNLGADFQFSSLLLRIATDLYDLIPQGILCILFTMYMLLDYNEKKEKTDLERLIDGQIRKYIIIKTCISFCVGVIIGFILYLFSVDMWLLFGLLTFLLNFIPNVGAMIAALLPLPIAILDPHQTWYTIVLIFIIPVSVHFCVGNFVEPNVMGKSFEMSAIAVLVALAFWGTVWGIVGAVMSVPINVTLHLWLRSIPHPMASFLGQLLVGEFKVYSIFDQFQQMGDTKVVEKEV